MPAASCIGAAISLRRYPVKSMLGEHLAALQLEARGVVGDRLYAVRDADGKFGSGKSTRRFRQMDGLLTLRASYSQAASCAPTVPTVYFPDGAELDAGDAAPDARLSALVGRPVTVTREAAIPHHDDGAIHLITTSSLRAIGLASAADLADERRFRPNLVIETPGEGFLEDGWIGRDLLVGDDVRLRVIGRAIRCVMIGFAQEELPADSGILRRLGEANAAHLGVYCAVVTPGVVHLGDPVRMA